MMEDHLPKIPMMASTSPTESSGSAGTDDSRGKFDREEQRVVARPFLSLFFTTSKWLLYSLINKPPEV